MEEIRGCRDAEALPRSGLAQVPGQVGVGGRDSGTSSWVWMKIGVGPNSVGP